MSESFIEILMDHILESAMIPKSQIERIVGPILSMYLEAVLTETFRNDPEISGRIVMVSPEFPFKKAGNWQSTNVDYLMINPDRHQLLFIELKTTDTSIDSEQNMIYHVKQEAVIDKGGAFLVEDLEKMRDRSAEFGKYQYILEQKVLPLKPEIGKCYDAKIIYLVPKSAEHKVRNHADRVLTFGMLADNIPDPFSAEWSIIRDRLCLLDDSSLQSRNYKYSRLSPLISSLRNKFSRGGSENNPQDVAAINVATPMEEAVLDQETDQALESNTRTAKFWQGVAKFPEMMQLCQKHGENIIIGFTGGIEAFKKSTLQELIARRFYRWDYTVNDKNKNKADWISGATVLDLINNHHGYTGK